MRALERAAKTTPLVVSAATGAGVPDVLRALLRVIDQRGTRNGPVSSPKPGILRGDAAGACRYALAKTRKRMLNNASARQWLSRAAGQPQAFHMSRSPLPRRLPPHRGEGRLLAPGRRAAGTLKEEWLASLAAGHRRACTRDKRDVLVVSSGAIALGRAVLQAAARAAQARGQPGRRRGRPDRAGAHLVRGARRATASPPARCW